MAPSTGRVKLARHARGLPVAVKLGAEWLVYFDKYRDHKYGAVKSTNLNQWTDVSDRIKVPTGLRHGTIFRVSAKELKLLEQQ